MPPLASLSDVEEGKKRRRQIINNDAMPELGSPMREYVLSFASKRIPSNGTLIKLNLPNLDIPELLLRPEEKAIEDLRTLLRYVGYEVRDRKTLAYFTIGKKLDIQAAAQCFLNFYDLVNHDDFKSPNREKIEQMEKVCFIEGFAQHQDGTYGALVNSANWNCAVHQATYLSREWLCYLFNLVDIKLLRIGLTNVINAKDVS